MKRFKRVTSVEKVMENYAENCYFNLKIKRTVPADETARAHMSVDVHICEKDGNYDPDMRIVKIRGIDTLDLQCILLELKDEISSLTSVHVN